MLEEVELIGGPLDGKKRKVQSKLRYIQIPEGFCLHIYKASSVSGENKFYYKGKDDPTEVKRKIIEEID